MNTITTARQKQTWYRLIALWVLCEGILGGMMHAVNMPFTGIIVSGGAVVCIALIAYYVPVKGAILKATIIVAVFKMMLGPHTPPTAYIALFFQGLMGQLLFFNLRFFRVSCILLAVLALVESALQRVIVLTLLYGNNFWKALDQFITKLTGARTVTNYSLTLATGYVTLHAFAGMVIGLYAGSLVWRSETWGILHKNYLIEEGEEALQGQRKNKRKKVRYIFLAAWILLVLLFLQSWLQPANAVLPAKTVLQIMFRSLLIILSWYFLVSPFLAALVKKWLNRRRLDANNDILQVTRMLPSAKYIFSKSWQLSAGEKGWRRLPVFCKIVLVNTLR